MSQTLLRKKVAIVGLGPVGILGSLLLENLGIEYAAFEKYPTPRSHPSAHWLSANSKVIMRQISGLNQQINSVQQPWQYFRYYRYGESLFGHELTLTDHFKPSIQQKLKKSQDLLSQKPNHIPQNLLLEILYQKVRNKQNLIFGKDIKQIKKKQLQNSKTNENAYILYDHNNNAVAQAQYVILCSGANTGLRNRLPSPLSQFHMEGKDNLMNIINIHFMCKGLADQLKRKDKNAMLHFIYGKKLIGILVNHSIDKTGTFVLQVPNYQPFVDLLQVYSARQVVSMTLGVQENVLKDLEVIHVGKWKLQGVLANVMHKNRIFLAGDSAHAYPPAGGFGMNSGFQDINQLIHSIYLSQKNKQVDETKLFTYYSQQRRKVNSQYLKKAMENYDITKSISTYLGYSPNILDYFASSKIMNGLISFLPDNKSKLLQPFRLRAMDLMYRRQYLKSPELNLFFDQFDLQIQNTSKIRKFIMKDIQKKRAESPNLYACEGEVSLQQINQIFGKIEQKNIKFFKRSKPGFQKAQKLVSSDGNVLLGQ